MPNDQCPQCGTAAPPGNKFCGNCGAPLTPAAAQASAAPASPAESPQVMLSSIKTFNIAVILLGAIALAVVVGAVGLILTGANVTSLIPIATAAVAALAGLLTQPGKQQ